VDKRRLGDRLAGGRVDDLLGGAVGRVDQLAIDEVLKLCQRCGCHCSPLLS